MESLHWLAELFRKTLVGGGFDAARGRPARDQIVLLPVSCVPPFRATGHLGPPRDHCGLGGGGWRARGSPQAVCIEAGEASPGVLVAPRALSKTPRVFRARCRPAPCPAPSCSAHEGSPGQGRALAQLVGARRPPALWPNDRLRDTDHVLAVSVPERETPAAPPPPPASLVLILSFLPPARACCNRHAAGVSRAPAARPCALVTAAPLSLSPPPAFKSRPSSPPPFPIMTRKPDPMRDTERRRDQRCRHQKRLAVLARCTCSCHLAGCPPCSTSAPPRGGPALPVSSNCAPPAGQGPPVAGGAWVPPPNPTPSQGGGNCAGGAGRLSLPTCGSSGPRPSTDSNQGGEQFGGGTGRPCLPPRDKWVPPDPWQNNQAGSRWEQPPDGNGGHVGRGWDMGGRRVSPRRCAWASPAGRSSQAGCQWDQPLQWDQEYGGRGWDSRDRDGSPRRNVWAPPGCQGQEAQEPGGYGGGGFSPDCQPSPRRNWVPPGGKRPNQPGGFGPLREDWWLPSGQASREAGGHAAHHDNWGPPGGGPAQAGDFGPICAVWQPSPLAGGGGSLRAGGGASPAVGSGGNVPRAKGQVLPADANPAQAGDNASPAAGTGGEARRTDGQVPPAPVSSPLSGGGV